MKKLFFTIVSLVCACSISWSQAMIYSRIDQDPASAGMAGAAIAGSPSFSWTAGGNASMMSFSEPKGDVSVSYQSWAPSEVTYINFGGFSKFGSKMSLAAGAVYGNGTEYNMYDEFGKSKGTFTPSDLMAGLAIAFKANDAFSAGVNVSYISQNVADSYSYNVISAGVSVAYAVSDFKVSAAVKSLGTAVEGASGDNYNQALSIGAAGLWNKEIGQKSLVKAALDAEFFTEGEFGASLGASYTYNRLATVRAGYHLGDTIMPSYASVGCGLSFFGVHLDAAYLLGTKETSPGGSFVFGIGYSF